MVGIGVPLGAVLAFIMVRTDIPGRRILEPAVLIPIFLSPIVTAFGYVVDGFDVLGELTVEDKIVKAKVINGAGQLQPHG